MNVDAWKALLGRTPSDPELAEALSEAGIKKIPKPAYRDGESFVQLELKGRGLEVMLTDAATLDGRDEDSGKGPLRLSSILAKVGKAHGRDLYGEPLPFGLTRAMSRAEVIRVLGKPTESDDGVDIWRKGDVEVVVGFAKTGELSDVSVMLPHATG